MSTIATFALGLGGGAAACYLTKNKHPNAPSTSSLVAPKAAPRNCAVHVERAGITVDGTRVEVGDAVRRCAAVGGAEVTVAPNAPASTCAALVAALDTANVPTVRNTGPRNAGTPHNSGVSSTFTFVVFPEGIWGKRKRVRYFKATPPTTWQDARDRLAAAGLLDRDALSPNGAGAWRLVTDPARFRSDRAEPLPAKVGRPRGAARRTKRFTREGRTVLRDGEAILYLERVDLGDQRYATSPHEADRLVEQIVSLLNERGVR